MLDRHDVWQEYLGLFALLNALIHFIVSLVIYRKKLVDKNLFYVDYDGDSDSIGWKLGDTPMGSGGGFIILDWQNEERSNL